MEYVRYFQQYPLKCESLIYTYNDAIIIKDSLLSNAYSYSYIFTYF